MKSPIFNGIPVLHVVVLNVVPQVPNSLFTFFWNLSVSSVLSQLLKGTSGLLDSTHLLARTVDALDIFFTLSLLVPFYANAHMGNVTFIHVKGILPYTIISFNCFDCCYIVM